MANEEHLARLRAGVDDWNAWREEHRDIAPDLSGATLGGADLGGANLSGATLGGADLGGANLSGATLGGANLSGANLSETNLSGMNLRGANLRGADLRKTNLRGVNLREVNLSEVNLSEVNLSEVNLSGMNLREMGLSGAILHGTNLSRTDLDGVDLSGADCFGADFRQASLIDSRLDGANLTGARLWETQRGGWSIKSVICQQAFWDRDGNEPTEYGVGDFERIFAEKPRIVLRYPGGMSPVDFAMLPLVVERLQAEHPDCALHIRSVRDDGNGATVTITVDDLAGRSIKDFENAVAVLRSELNTFQLQLQQEKSLRLQAEAGLNIVVNDVLPKILERALPKTEVNVGQITGPTIIEGATMSRDTYNIPGQAGAVGPHSHAHDMTFQQIQNSLDLSKLAEELGRLRDVMKQETEGTREQDKAVVAVAEAEKAAIRGDGPTALRHLKTAGKWTLGIAEKIGVTIAAEAIKMAMIGPT